jgi:hypothetical protein
VLRVSVPLVAVNIWFDAYHPGAISFDIIIVLVLFFRYYDSQRGS